MPDTPEQPSIEVEEAPATVWHFTNNNNTGRKQKETRAPAVHDWPGGSYGRFGRPQYIALLEAVGWKVARKKMKDVIIWRDGKLPPDEILRNWELDWQEGRVTVSDADVQKMRQRLRAAQEAKSWAAQEAAADAAIALSNLAAEGKLDQTKQVQLNYANMSAAFGAEKYAAAFGTPKPTAQINNFFAVDTGKPRRPRVLKSPRPKELQQEIVNAEFREVPDDGGS